MNIPDSYQIMQVHSTVCPTCGKPVKLLFNESEYTPAFYICFTCEFVGQVGVGVVKEVDADAEEEEGER